MSVHCKACGEVGVRDERWDSYYCTRCNVWLEGKCLKPETINKSLMSYCYFECWNRPDQPLPQSEVSALARRFEETRG